MNLHDFNNERNNFFGVVSTVYAFFNNIISRNIIKIVVIL